MLYIFFGSNVLIGNGMALIPNHFYCKFYGLISAAVGLANAVFLIQYQTPTDCVTLSAGAATSLYFNSVQLKCVKCPQPSSAQTVSADGAID